MDAPKITYHILESIDTYVQQNNAYIGTYTGDEPLTVNFRIWNNFRGTEDVEDLQNFNLVLRFLTEEDNVLLKYISLAVTNEIDIPCIIEDNALIGSFVDPIILSGKANTGSDEYVNNYISITISFNPDAGVYLKDHDLKSLVMDVVEL